MPEAQSRYSDFKPPNWVTSGAIIAILLLGAAIIYAFNKGENAAQSVQMVSQSALVIAGLIGLPLSIWRSWTAHIQAITGQRQLEGFQKQIALLEAGAEADRLQKGTELLESEKLVVRIAGIAILRSIAAQQEHKFKAEAFRVLESFARSASNSEDHRLSSDDSENSKSPEDLAESFRALLETRENTAQEIGSMTLRGIKIANAAFESFATEVLFFRNCTFSKSKIGKHTWHHYDDCTFSECDIVFHIYDMTEYRSCVFQRCTITGEIGSDLAEKIIVYDCNVENLVGSNLIKMEDDDIPF